MSIRLCTASTAHHFDLARSSTIIISVSSENILRDEPATQLNRGDNPANNPENEDSRYVVLEDLVTGF